MNEIDTQSGLPVQPPDEDKLQTYEYGIKCGNCGLHYAVFSWERWAETRAKHGGFCPECGIGGNKIIYGPTIRPEFIFELVPGRASLSGITETVRSTPFGTMAPPPGAGTDVDVVERG